MTVHEMLVKLSDADDGAVVVVKMPPIKYQAGEMRVARVDTENDSTVILELVPLWR